MSHHWITYGIALIACISSTSAYAQMTSSAVAVGARVVSFLQPPPSGLVVAAIVYEPGNDVSEREARAIEHELGSGLKVGALSFRARRVASNALGELTGARLAFVTRGTNYRQVTSATNARSIVTIASDPVCTRAGQCTVAIQSSPRIQIIVSRAACLAARIKFSAAFLMLVREI